MRGTWTWILPLAVVAALAWLHPLGWPLRPGLMALLALCLDEAWRRARPDLPLHKRHLSVFLAVAILAALQDGQAYGALWPAAWHGALDAAAGGAGLAIGSLARLRSRHWRAHSWQRGATHRPDPSRDLILVADPHWNRELVGLEAATAAHPDADWLFLGDVFDVWVGLPGMETEAQARFLDWVRARRAAGRWVGLWLGNREFHLDRHARDFDLMGEGVGGALPEEKLAFEHGDLINTADWRYRLWNLVSRSGPLWIAFRLLPAATAARLAARIEAGLRTTNREYKLAFPRAAFAAAAAEHADSSFLTGHFHTHEVEANGTALPWAYEGRYMVWRKGRVEALEG